MGGTDLSAWGDSLEGGDSEGLPAVIEGPLSFSWPVVVEHVFMGEVGVWVGGWVGG